MNQADWANESTRCLTIFLDGGGDPDTDVDGRPLIDDDFLLLVNGWKEPVEFVLPTVSGSPSWLAEIDTGRGAETPGHRGGRAIDGGGRVLIPDFSLMVLRGDHQTATLPV